MWDSNTPLQVLKTMPKVLEEGHLEKLQMLLEADKYKNQLVSGTDLCGTYAPFCSECNKESKYPCAVAYVNYLKEQGEDVEIASNELEHEKVSVEEENTDEQLPVNEEKVASEQPPVNEEEVVADEVKPEEKAEKTRIRIAIARKKTLL